MKSKIVVFSLLCCFSLGAYAEKGLFLQSTSPEKIAEDLARTQKNLDMALDPQKIEETRKDIHNALEKAEVMLKKEQDFEQGKKGAEAPSTLTPREALSRSEKLMKKWKPGAPMLSVEQTNRLMEKGATGTDVQKLFKKFEEISQKQQAEKLDTEGVLLFVSFSMPENILKEYARQAYENNVTLVLRGFYENKTAQHTSDKILKIGLEQKFSAEWMIHPGLFDAYKIKRVPALVVSGDGATVKDDGCFSKGDFAAVTGEISIIGGLEQMLSSDLPQNIRRVAQAKLDQSKKQRRGSWSIYESR